MDVQLPDQKKANDANKTKQKKSRLHQELNKNKENSTSFVNLYILLSSQGFDQKPDEADGKRQVTLKRDTSQISPQGFQFSANSYLVKSRFIFNNLSADAFKPVKDIS